jgi:O-antigen ligase
LVPGLLNNANYTGLLSAGLTIFFWLNKDYRHLLVGIILVFISQSKTALFCLLIALPLFFSSDKDKSRLRFYAYGVFGFIALSPLLLFLFELVSPEFLKIWVNAWSGSRYSIQLSFLELLKSSPFGVGYERSHEMIAKYMMHGSSLVTSGSFTPYFLENIGAHSVYIKILCELGFSGYFCYLLFIYLLLRRGLQTNPSVAIGFLSICGAQMWLEGLNEFIFYFFAALIFRCPSDFLKNENSDTLINSY